MRRSSRDEVIAMGARAARRAERAFRQSKRTSQWIYNNKVKVGTRATENVQYMAWNIPHLRGILIANHAEEGESLTAVAVARVMKAGMRSPIEDY